MKIEHDGFFVTVPKNHQGNWKVGYTVFCCALALLCFNQSVLGAGVSTTVIDADGDVATVQLSGSGSMTVSLVNPSNGPIDHITLFNTDSSSSLTIKIKKSATGNGTININAIVGSGSLKRLSAKSANLVGSGINLGGFIGGVTIGNVTGSAITLGGNGVVSGGIALGSFSGGVVSNSQIQISGSVGKFSAAQMLDSQLWVGYTPIISRNPMAGGAFVSGDQIAAVTLKGVRGSTAPAFVNSTIAAQSIGTITLPSVNTNNNQSVFGILVDTAIKSMKVDEPKFTWKPTGRIEQTLGDFEARRLGEAIMNPNVHLLTAADLNGSTMSNNVLLVTTNSASLQGVGPGDVLVSGAGNGLLVTVVSVTPQGDSLSLQTTPASLTNVFQTVAFDKTFTFIPASVAYSAPGVTVVTNGSSSDSLARNVREASTQPEQTQSAQFSTSVYFEKTLVDTNNLQIMLSGSAVLTITPSIAARITDLELESASASVEVDLSGSVDLSLSGGVSTNVEVLLTQIPGEPIPLSPGVVAVPTLLLYGGVGAEVNASIGCGANLDANYLAGATYQNGTWSNIASHSISFTETNTNPTVGGSLRGYIRPEIVFDIDEVAGPDIYAQGDVTLAASADLAKDQFCWSLTGDLDAGAGITLDVFGIVLPSYNAQLFSVTNQLAGSCTSLGSSNWTEVTSTAPWSARHAFGSVVFNNQMWVLGGIQSNGSAYFNDVWSSPDGTNWTKVTSAAPWGPRSTFGSVVFNNQMWVLGGIQSNGSTYLNDVWSSTDGTNWTKATSAAPWSPREAFGAVAYNGQMWVLGGFNGNPCNCRYDDVWSSPDGTNWTLVANAAAWTARARQAAVVFNGQMWVLGGDNVSRTNDVWSSSDGANWTKATPAAQWSVRSGQAAVVFNGQMWAFGGDNISNFFNDVWSSPDGTNWTQVTPAAPWSPRSQFGSFVFDGRTWVVGGDNYYNSSGSDFKDAWSSQ